MNTLNSLIEQYKEHEVDFVFPSIDDTPVYIDINLLYHSPERRWHEVQSIIHEYFNQYLERYRKNTIDEGELIKALEFPEVKFIALGYCVNGKDGRGGAKEKAIAIKKHIFDDDTVQEIGIEALARMSIIIPNVGPDTFSDMVANLGIQYLIDYTNEQVELYNLKTADFQIGHSFNIDRWEWEPIPKVKLPYFETEVSVEPRILVPRHLVRKVPVFSPEGFYENYLKYILRHEEEHRIHAARTIGRKPKVLFKNVLNDLKNKYGKKGIAIREIVRRRPELLSDYVANPETYIEEKRKKKTKEKINWQIYIDEIEGLPRGQSGAKAFAEYLRKVFTAMYSGHLTNGKLEEVSEDRVFRYDICFGNGATTPLFKMVNNQQFSAGVLIIEAKNYDVTTLGNKEFNQGRAYTIVQGREFVILASRNSITTKDIRRSRRHFLTQRCLILPIDCKDILRLLEERKVDKLRFDEFLTERVKEILQA